MLLFLVIVAVAAGVAFLVLKSKKVEKEPIAHVQKVEEPAKVESKEKPAKKVAVKKQVKKEK